MYTASLFVESDCDVCDEPAELRRESDGRFYCVPCAELLDILDDPHEVFDVAPSAYEKWGFETS